MLRSRKSHTFIAANAQPIGKYTRLDDTDEPIADEDIFADIYLEPSPDLLKSNPGSPFDTESWTTVHPEENPFSDDKEVDPRSPAEIKFTRDFNYWRLLQKHNRPHRKATLGFVVKARTGFKKVGQRYHSYTGIFSKNRRIIQKTRTIRLNELPEPKEISEFSKNYRYPSSRLNQYPRLRTFKAVRGYHEAISNYIKYLVDEALTFEKREERAEKWRAGTKEYKSKALKLEYDLAHEKGLLRGWYLCEGAEGTPWENCDRYCDWPSCKGLEVSEQLIAEMEDANNNINVDDKLPVRFLFLKDIRRETKGAPPPTQGSGINTGWDITCAWDGIHHTVQRAQNLNYNHRSTESYEFCRSYLKETDSESTIEPPLTAIDKAYLSFSAGSAARFAHPQWSVRKRITEIEKYMNLAVVHVLSDSSVLKLHSNRVFYDDVKAKVHYWGEMHQLNIMMPQRPMDDLVKVLNTERLKRLARLHEMKRREDKRDYKKGYTVQMSVVPIKKAAKPLVDKPKGLIARVFGRNDKNKKKKHKSKKSKKSDKVKETETGENKEGILRWIWNTILGKESADNGKKPKQEKKSRMEREFVPTAELDILDMIAERDKPDEENVIWIGKDGRGRRRQTPLPQFNYNKTINHDPFGDYPPTIEYRQAVLG
ncbi:hypothetical protein TWF730_010226 [Orbilia blumenaviensis]|uniref:Uncharacterized protein n=1 Tax=Orbilia blumenaviensis TaxID=1796055 RepID=A0AAV9UP69_9PEZI